MCFWCLYTTMYTSKIKVFFVDVPENIIYYLENKDGITQAAKPRNAVSL
jgi:hypothetical protein